MKCQICIANKKVNHCTVDADGKHHSFNDKPAVVYREAKHDVFSDKDYTEVNKWYKHGILHRTNGPAIEWSDNDHEWLYNGLRPDGFFEDICVGKSVKIKNCFALVFKHLEGLFYEAIMGNKKVLVVNFLK